MTAQQAFQSGFPWTIYRNRSGWPRWWQRGYEAWLVITGRYTFWHAYHDGKHCGSMMEYRRIVENGGDLTPLLCAAVNVLKPGDMSEQQGGELRAAIWRQYKETRRSPFSDKASTVSGDRSADDASSVVR